MPISSACSLALLGLPCLAAAPASAGSEAPPVERPPEAASPLDGPTPAPARPPATPVPWSGAEPLHGSAPPASAAPLPPEGAKPLDGPTPAHRRSPAAPLPSDGVEPLHERPPSSDGRLTIERPLGLGHEPAPAEPLDPASLRLVRIDLMVGSVWRIREADASIGTSVEVGRMHGFSGAFHTDFIIVSDRDSVRALDVPIGLGAIARGRLRGEPLYGSVGLSAGILVHRANTERGVVHRVDPDFRLPIRLAWTMADFGLSVAVVTGYSVRDRVYERRGAEVLKRHSVRVGLMVGVHWDVMAGRAKARRYHRRQDGTH
jgi:hypothetical protein